MGDNLETAIIVAWGRCQCYWLIIIRIKNLHYQEMKMKTDPVIAVKDVDAAAEWYQTLLNCSVSPQQEHGFKILTDDDGVVLLCLHRWKMDEHPTMMDQSIMPGNGLILYFRTNNLEDIRKNAEELGANIVEDMHVNPRSQKREFSIRDIDGYYLTISEYHGFGYEYE